MPFRTCARQHLGTLLIALAAALVSFGATAGTFDYVNPVTGKVVTYKPSFAKEAPRPKWRKFDRAQRKWVTHTATNSELRERHRMKYARATVPFHSSEPVGTLIIDTTDRFLYRVNGDRTATRYGIGVGRDGFTWSGIERVSRKAEWPDWRPPAEMRQREPYLPLVMAGGPNNPLGARALYLGSTLYRIHGTHQDHTIGYAVSSGCFRMLNEDIEHLYERVKLGTEVIVLGPRDDRSGLMAALSPF